MAALDSLTNNLPPPLPPKSWAERIGVSAITILIALMLAQWAVWPNPWRSTVTDYRHTHPSIYQQDYPDA